MCQKGHVQPVHQVTVERHRKEHGENIKSTFLEFLRIRKHGLLDIPISFGYPEFRFMGQAP